MLKTNIEGGDGEVYDDYKEGWIMILMYNDNSCIMMLIDNDEWVFCL